MSGRSPRWIREIQYPVTGFAVSLTGDMDSNYAYVTIDGTKYTAAQELVLDPGSSITVTVGTNAKNYGSTLSITMDGSVVRKGSRRDHSIRYTFQLTSPCSLVFTKHSISVIMHYTCAITTS